MLPKPNALQWQGGPGHYEVYYLTLTDPRSGTGIWIRYTMLAPRTEPADPASCALWLAAMEPGGRRIARKATFPIESLRAGDDPFELRLDGATLSDHGAVGAFEDVSWKLRWRPSAV